MSKSLGNIYTLNDLEKKGFTAQTFRLLVLESHYHSESVFTWEIIEASKNRMRNWLNVASTMWQLPEDDQDATGELIDALADNLNTPQALKIIDLYFQKVSSQNKSPNSGFISTIEKALGIDLKTSDINEEQKKLLKKRETARKNKKWEESDKLRDQLLDEGVQVRDDSVGQIWSIN